MNAKSKKIKFPDILIFVIIIALAISPAFALGEGNRNLLLIVLMGFSPLIVITYHKKLYDNEIYLLLFMVSIIAIPILFNPQSMRWSTVLYSQMFCFTFLAYNRLVNRTKYFTIERYLVLLKFLIYAYFIVLLIQQFCVMTGLPIFNLSNYNPNDPWKLNSLAAEPSHSARIVALLMFSFITIKELFLRRLYNFKTDFADDKWVWISFIWTMVTLGSATAFIFIPLVLLKFLRFNNIIPIIIILAVITLLLNKLDITVYERAYNTLLATLTFDEKAIIAADHSAAVRIVPFIILVKMINITSLTGWVGHGIDYVSLFLYSYLPGVPVDFSAGGMLQFWLEYGFISFALFIFFSLSNSYKKGDYISVIFWFMLVFLYGINNQMVWLCIILLYTTKYFYKISITNK